MALDLSRIQKSGEVNSRPWHGAAFIVESLVLLAFLIASLAVVIQLMGAAHERGTEADLLSNAVTMASNDAETFAADPTSGDRTTQFTSTNGELVETAGDSALNGEAATIYELVRTVERTSEAAGTLYAAHIAVAHNGETIYEVDTSRYVSDEGVGR